MLKKSLLLIIVTTLTSCTAFLIYRIIERLNDKKESLGNLETRSHLTLFDFDSAQFFLPSNRKSVIVYFNSECNHCQYELDQIFANTEKFIDADVVLTSSELIRAIKQFAKANYPGALENIRFLKINPDEAYKTFGSLAVPQIFIYGTDGLLIRKFNGETKIDAILQYL
ncbi:MAG TPA: hypothetical protein VFZ52_01815 [Chryseolinea sp.]